MFKKINIYTIILDEILFFGVFPERICFLLTIIIGRTLMLDESDLIKSCKKFNRTAQKELYDKYVKKMLAVCYRYLGNKEDANDIVQEGFITVFTEINKFSEIGSLEGWIKRIMINKAINYYKKTKKINDTLTDIDDIENLEEDEKTDNLSFVKGETSEFEVVKHADLSKEELYDSLEKLEPPFRIVFNLFHFENLSHKEIGEMLLIDEKTSRTRLFRAKKMLQAHLYTVSMNKLKLSKQK